MKLGEEAESGASDGVAVARAIEDCRAGDVVWRPRRRRALINKRTVSNDGGEDFVAQVQKHLANGVAVAFEEAGGGGLPRRHRSVLWPDLIHSTRMVQRSIACSTLRQAPNQQENAVPLDQLTLSWAHG